MNEFIVWDNKNKEWIKYSHVINNVGNHNFTIHQYIGKTDINDKKIYADCSIVEFDKKYEINKEIYQTKLKGIFIYDEISLKYKIELFENEVYKCLFIDYNIYDVTDLKIIDTIQENKLGLMG